MSHIGFGTESASPEVLAHEQTSSADRGHSRSRAQVRQSGIRVTFNLIFGYPGEKEHHRQETLRVMGDIAEKLR